MTITKRQQRQLRHIGHSLKPIVTVAAHGLNDSVLKEIQRALDDHELIKVKLAIIDRQQRQAIAASICQQTRAEIVQMIGKTILLYLPALEPNIKCSNIHRHLGQR